MQLPNKISEPKGKKTAFLPPVGDRLSDAPRHTGYRPTSFNINLWSLYR